MDEGARTEHKAQGENTKRTEQRVNIAKVGILLLRVVSVLDSGFLDSVS